MDLEGALELAFWASRHASRMSAAPAAFCWALDFGGHGLRSHLQQMNAHTPQPFRETAQTDLFGAPAAGPKGFCYQPDLITADEEAQLVDELARLPFEPFNFPRPFRPPPCGGVWLPL